VKPKGLAVDSDGHLYVTDSASNNILLFDREGIFLFTWGRAGSLNGDFWTPAGIFIDERDTIYIADRSNGRVQTFQYVK
jgi:DNA-binding beta-propeller fold protein YncE